METKKESATTNASTVEEETIDSIKFPAPGDQKSAMQNAFFGLDPSMLADGDSMAFEDGCSKDLEKLESCDAGRVHNNELLFKMTFEDGYLPFSNVTMLDQEFEKKALAKNFVSVKDFTGELVTVNITKFESKILFDKKTGQKFDVKQTIYSKEHQRYVQLTKYDNETKIFECRLVGKNEENKQGTVKTHQDLLTNYITVQLRVKTSNKSDDHGSDEGKIKVHINDKLSKLKEIYDAFKIDGTFMCNGKLLENMADSTFAKNFILDGEKIMILCSDESCGPAQKWIRFPNLYLTDYFYMETYSFDAVIFIPKKTIKFLGFGIMSSYNNKDMTYKIRWVIDDDESCEELEWSCPDADKDPEKKWFEIKLSDLGVSPIKVDEGQEIHIMAKVTSDDYECRRCLYGYNGYQREYSIIPDQEYDFETKSSRFNNNCTSDSWGQIPFILYS